MSGIAGIFLRDGRRAEPDDIGRQVGALAHRGPDRHGTWSSGSIALAHLALWTTPESIAEAMPLGDARDSLVITADVRLDNRDELFDLLDIPSSGRGIGDAALILHAYKKWNEACVERLVGDFSFAIWDAEAHVLFCARDRFGVKPFFYYCSGEMFLFASEIKGLLAIRRVPRRLNETRVGDYLLSNLEDRESTFYRDILRLPAAHTLTVTAAAVRRRKYWALDPDVEIRYRSDDEYAEAFREKFTQAVRGSLRSAYPVGATLSGGLDSSAIVCVARYIRQKAGGPALHTFSAIFPEVPECDERPYIDAMVAGHGLHAHRIPCDRLSPLADCDEMLRQQDEPILAPNLFMYRALCAESRQHGIRVMLDGIDGDSTVSHGVARLTELAATGRFAALIGEANGLSRHFGRPQWHWVWSYGVRPHAPAMVRTIWRRGRQMGERWRPRNATLIRPEFLRLVSEKTTSPRTAREDHWRKLTDGAHQHLLEVTDTAAAGVAVEPRHPFFDHRVVQFCLGLPADQKLNAGWTRLVMRHALAGVLPDAIRWRPGKTALGTNFARGLMRFERRALLSFAKEPPALISRFLDVDRLRQIVDGFTARNDQSNTFTIWKTFVLARWLQSTGLTQ